MAQWSGSFYSIMVASRDFPRTKVQTGCLIMSMFLIGLIKHSHAYKYIIRALTLCPSWWDALGVRAPHLHSACIHPAPDFCLLHPRLGFRGNSTSWWRSIPNWVQRVDPHTPHPTPRVHIATPTRSVTIVLKHSTAELYYDLTTLSLTYYCMYSHVYWV